jgi:photosynthetic reaction center H subunit
MAHDDRTRFDSTTGALVHSRELHDFHVPDGRPDPRGWTVRSADGRDLGKVEDLLVDTSTNQVRYLELRVDDDIRKAGGRDWALVPIGAARLDDERDDVIVNLTSTDLNDVPVYERQRLTRDYERSLHGYLEERPHLRASDARDASLRADRTADRSADFYGGPLFDDREFYGARRAGMGGAADRATSSGLADRVADRVDDIKDRVDANPASRPGPDATDRTIGRR